MRVHLRVRIWTVVVFLCGSWCFPLVVSAQTRRPRPPTEPKWTIEGVGGFGFAASVPDGTSAQLPVGTPFTTEGGFPSRSIASWYLGDGTTLFNDVASQFGSRFAVQVPRISGIDAHLGSAALEGASGPAFGARVTRKLNRRLALEFGIVQTKGSVSIDDDLRSAVDAARTSFQGGFNALLQTIPQTGLQVTSSATVPDDVSTSQTTISGVLNVTLVRSGKLGAHVSAGVGRTVRSSDAVNITLQGNYQFRIFDLNPINETDNVTIALRDEEPSTDAVLGGGISYDVAARHGLRVDARVLVGSSGQTVTVSASPSVTRTNPTIALPSMTSPSIQFSNTSALQSSLSGSASVTTFTADGVEVRPQVTVSYFVRF